VGVALYPEDGTTRDTLLNAADAAMYVAKQTKRHVDNLLAAQQNSEANFEDRG
jgi:GGDEF domain-containing protein